MPQVSTKRRASAVALAALLSAMPFCAAPILVAGLLLPFAAMAKDGGSLSGHSGGDSDSGGGSDSGSGGGSDSSGSDNSGSGNSGREGRDNGGDHRGPHDVRRSVSGFTVEVKTEGNDVEVIYPDGWSEEIRGGVFQLRDPAGRTVVERHATAPDLSRLNDIAR